jgi:hypothetical protein
MPADVPLSPPLAAAATRRPPVRAHPGPALRGGERGGRPGPWDPRGPRLGMTYEGVHAHHH